MDKQTDGWTDMCENITFPHPSDAVGKKTFKSTFLLQGTFTMYTPRVQLKSMVGSLQFLLNNTNVTFRPFLYKIDMELVQKVSEQTK